MKLGTRLLVFSSIFLVLLPWLGYHFIKKIEQSLLQGQEEAQLMVATAISSVLNGYKDIFNVEENALYVYPLDINITIDGYDEDWRHLRQQHTSYANGAFSLLLAGDDVSEGGQYLYAYLKVNDRDIVYRNPRYVPLDSSDHIRLEFLDDTNQLRRIMLLTEGQGDVRFYEVNSDWQTLKSGSNINAASGFWQETDYGYDLELRIPAAWVRTAGKLSLSIVNVFGENERYPDTVDSTKNISPEHILTDSLNSLLFQSAEIGRVIQNLSRSDSQICIVDKYRRVRAVTGGQGIQASLCRTIERVNQTLVDDVLLGREQVVHYEDAGEDLIIAAQPVFEGNKIIGAVLVSKNSRQILALQRDTLKDVAFASLLLFALVFASLLLFSSWLAFRINRLKKQAAEVVDECGRIVSHIDFSDSQRQDEIGELSRSFSSLLDKLNSYTRFLETVPRMLRHEILNPVNTISMSLQTISRLNPDDAGVRNAQQASRQLEFIVNSLTEASHIDEALSGDSAEVFDFSELVCEYVSNSSQLHPQQRLTYQGPCSGLKVRGSDLRIAQLLDKIKDNALDFADPGTTIRFELSQSGEVVELAILNQGRVIPDEVLETLFTGMTSCRPQTEGRPHLGIGLFIARRIAMFHGGDLQVVNRSDVPGVRVTLRLPLV
jgi:signal transduction histidine kinase